ncbi:MAG: HAD-IA family hydrolase [Candidatus Poribacteria bacterium]
MTKKIDAVLFDFDGTLVNIKIDFVRMRQDVLSLGVEYGVSPKSDIYVLEAIDEIFNTLLAKDEILASKFKKQAEQILIDIELDAVPTSICYPNADKTLEILKNKGIKVGIVTRNCRLAVLKTSEKAGFIYDVLLTRDDVQKVKPDPQHLWDALNLLEADRESSIMVGDHPMDILAGKKAGMKTAAVLTTKTEDDFKSVEPDIVLNNVSEILKILDARY